ncbi:MAG: hypothetical protein ABI667_09320 [Sphingomicrobium sp.]
MRKIITAAIVPAAMLALAGCNKTEAPAENAVVTDEVVAPSESVDNLVNATDNLDNAANATDQGSTDHGAASVDGSTDHVTDQGSTDH